MAATPAPRAHAVDLTEAVLYAVAAIQILPGVLAFVAPGAFYDLLGPYPPQNDHFIKDLGSWQIALGAAALIGARRPDWRVPILGVLTLQFALHTVSHAIDVGATDPSWNGPVSLALEALVTLVLAALLVKEHRS